MRVCMGKIGVRQMQTADLQTADLQTYRPADLQTCRLADLQTRSELTGSGGGRGGDNCPRRFNPEEALS